MTVSRGSARTAGNRGFSPTDIDTGVVLCVEVLCVEAERAGDAAAARVDLGDAHVRDAGQHRHRADVGLLVAVTVVEDPATHDSARVRSPPSTASVISSATCRTGPATSWVPEDAIGSTAVERVWSRLSGCPAVHTGEWRWTAGQRKT
jgi:hypothetical protein